jgi:hypothetical protein
VTRPIANSIRRRQIGLDSEARFSTAMAAPPRRSLLVLLAGVLVFASLATLATAIYEDQVGLADWYVCLLA